MDGDGRELFYRDGSKMMAVSMSLTSVPKMSEPAKLFEGRYSIGTVSIRNYDVSPDGRFIIVRDELDAGRLNIILNWFSALKRLAPSR